MHRQARGPRHVEKPGAAGQRRDPEPAGRVPGGEHGEGALAQKAPEAAAQVRGSEHADQPRGQPVHTGLALHGELALVKPVDRGDGGHGHLSGF